MAEKKSVLVGMSGGVDSAVTALLLLEQGYEVQGATFQLWPPKGSTLPEGEQVQLAREICDQLGIKHHVFDYRERFQQEVVDPFVSEYEVGRTPNPCVNCNRQLKFGSFLQQAAEMGFDHVATGHYVRVEQQGQRFVLRMGVSRQRDQSYFLYRLTQQQLPHILTPLGVYDKPQVRKLALDAGLAVASRSDSQDICFIPDGDYVAFLKQYADKTEQTGHFVNEAGAVLGNHRGVWNYTVGQRKGLGISFGKPMFVTRIDAATGSVVLGEQEELFSTTLTAGHVSWIDSPPAAPIAVAAKIRSAAQPAPATVTPAGNQLVYVEFSEPQRAITPGQSVVFYDQDVVVGGGIIEGRL